MSAVPCNFCGGLRKVEQVFSSEGWHNPPHYACGAPGWLQGDGMTPFEQPDRNGYLVSPDGTLTGACVEIESAP